MTNGAGGRLESWKDLSQIIALIAIPVVLAGIGYFVQKSIADIGLKKDYIQLALSVLNQEPTGNNTQLRKWAISVLDQNSPVPLPAALKEELTNTLTFDLSQLKTIAQGTIVLNQPIGCKAPPDPQTGEWMLKNYPSHFKSCGNGEIGEILGGTHREFKIVGPSAASSGSK